MTRQQTARLAGALYLAMGLPGGFAIAYIPSVFVVPGDAATTASRIAASPMLYRFGVFAWGVRSQGIRAATMYWGVWLLPLGILVYRSGFLPRLLGVLVIVAGCSYVVDCLAYYFVPDVARIVALVSTPFQAAGEIGFSGWMLIKGVKDRA